MLRAASQKFRVRGNETFPSPLCTTFFSPLWVGFTTLLMHASSICFTNSIRELHSPTDCIQCLHHALVTFKRINCGIFRGKHMHLCSFQRFIQRQRHCTMQPNPLIHTYTIRKCELVHGMQMVPLMVAMLMHRHTVNAPNLMFSLRSNESRTIAQRVRNAQRMEMHS